MSNKIKYISINKKIIYIENIPNNVKTFNDLITNNNTNNTNTNNTNTNNTINYNSQNYYILNNGKLIDKYETIYTFINNYNKKNKYSNNNNILHLDINIKQNGGGIGDLFKAILKIGDFFKMIFKALLWFVKFVLWFVQFLLWLFIDLLNPLTLFTDFFNSLIAIVLAICRLPFDILMALMSFSVNILGGWMQGFWGWDQSSLTANDKNSNYFKKLNRNKGKKCYLTNTNTVPFSVVLGTILCPPIGVFMDMGLTGWLNILICILLTLLFYIPGLVYALLIIYS
jgi:uncharacterized membrane protein YqaE (UPF0057 family)